LLEAALAKGAILNMPMLATAATDNAMIVFFIIQVPFPIIMHGQMRRDFVRLYQRAKVKRARQDFVPFD
jgi:hypothetical protein